jgi:hypothetical protein
MTALEVLYDRLFAASAAGDARAAHDAFLAVVGLRPRREATRVPTALPARTVAMRRYGEPRRIDLVALAAGARRVAKFEDLSEADAARLAARLGAEGLTVVRVGPYTKRFDVSVSDAAGAARVDLHTVIASRGAEAPAIAEAERDRSPEGTRRAGLLLGYPPCCVDAFVALAASGAAEAEGINEAAVRSTAGLDGEIPWEMNTLSHMSPVGFTPCRAACPGALAFARRLLDALGRADASGLAVVERVLRRPVLFFRYPIFYVLDGAPAPARAVHYAAALPNDDGTGLPPALAAWQADEIGSVLAAGDRVEIEGGALSVRRGGEVIAAWALADARVPMLLRFVRG